MNNDSFSDIPFHESSTEEIPALIECGDHSLANAQLLTSGIVIGSLVIVISVSILIPSAALFIIVSLIVASVGVYCWFSNREKQRISKILNQWHDLPLRCVVRDLCTPTLFDSLFRSKRWAAELMTRGCKGYAVRICKTRRTHEISPLNEWFEPIPLDENTVMFEELESISLSRPQNVSEKEPDSHSASGIRRARRVMIRNLRLGGVFASALFGLFVAKFFANLWQALRSRQISFELLVWGMLGMLLIFGVGGRGAWGSRKQWLLVPGGLVQRKSGLFKKDWDVHLFARAESVLIVRHEQTNIWRAYVADATTQSAAGMTPREATMLLRAWLSPLPTPSADRLTDLA